MKNKICSELGPSGDDGAKAAKGKGRGRGRRGAVSQDATRQDESDQWSSKMGKWAVRTVDLIFNPGFHVCLRIRSRIAKVLDQLLWTVQKGSRRDAIGDMTNLAYLVYGKAAQIHQGILDLSSDRHWTDILNHVAERFSDATAGLLRGEIHTLIMSVYSDYGRRIMEMIMGPPQVMLFAKSDPASPDADRCAFALRLVRAQMSDLHINFRKLRLLFEPELQSCAMNLGVVATTLFAAAKVLRETFVGDSQEIEGVISMLKAVVRKCRKIELPHLDAHTGIRKAIGFGAGNDGSLYGWNAFLPVMSDIVEEALTYVSTCDQVLANTAAARWAAPKPSDVVVPSDPGRLVPAKKVVRSLRWAIFYNSRFNACVRQNPLIVTGKAVISMAIRGHVEFLEFWTCSCTYRFSCMLFRVDIVGDATGQLCVAPFDGGRQQELMSSYEVFRRWYMRLKRLDNPVLNLEVRFLPAWIDLGGSGRCIPEPVNEWKALCDLTYQCIENVQLQPPNGKRSATLALVDGAVDDAAPVTDDVIIAMLDEDGAVDSLDDELLVLAEELCGIPPCTKTIGP